MRSNHSRSSSSSILSEQTEQILLEPLLSSEQSIDGLLENENRRDFQSICISRLGNLRHLMSVRSARSCCFATLRFLPVLFILAILGWSYYAYVVQMCIFTVENIAKKVVYLCIYHVLIILFLWSYYRTMFEKSIQPSREFYIGDVEGERIASAQTIEERRTALIRLARQANLPILTRHFDGSVRYCFVCQCIKPDRAHHCSVCEKCVLRYDHHCPWTNSCISYGNYKFFVLFLGYALLFCVFVAATSLEYFIQFWEGITNAQKEGTNTTPSSGKFHLLFLFFASIMFAISVSSLFFYHLYLTGKNRTTLESFRAPIFANGPQKEGFNLGTQKNFQEIFGTNFFKGFLPLCTTRGDGIHYQVNHMLVGNLTQRSGRTSNETDSPSNRSNAVFLPMDRTTTNSTEHDRNYLLSGPNSNTRSMIK